MRLNLSFDEGLMETYARRNASPLFIIYWTHNKEFYPVEGWEDFGTVVLGWWLRAAKDLLTGANEIELDFMDGPYSLTLRSIDDSLFISALELETVWTVPRQDFIWELISAAEHVCNKLAELNLPDTTRIEDGVVSLRIDATAAPRRKSLTQAKIS